MSDGSEWQLISKLGGWAAPSWAVGDHVIIIKDFNKSKEYYYIVNMDVSGDHYYYCNENGKFRDVRKALVSPK